MNNKSKVQSATMGIFEFGPQNMTNFTGFNSHGNDCVPNALEILGAISADEASALRLLNRPFFTPEVIREMDNKTPPHIKWDDRWIKIERFKELMKALPPNKAMFAMSHPTFSKSGTNPNSLGHAFILAKDTGGKLAWVDPQNPKIYTEDDSEFKDFIDQYTIFGILVFYDYS